MAVKRSGSSAKSQEPPKAGGGKAAARGQRASATRKSTERRSAAKPRTIDEYLAPLPAAQRAALEKLRKTLRGIVPDAEECINYGVPGFRVDGKVVAWFAASKNHLSYFPGAALSEFELDLADYETSKGTIRFQPDAPLPVALIRKLVKARMKRVSVG